MIAMILALTFGCAVVSSGAGPAITLDPPVVLRGDPVSITVSGLDPGAQATIICRRKYGRENTIYESAATFVADSAGSVDVAKRRPLAAPWRDADGTGLFWSMRNTGSPAPGAWTRHEVYVEVHADADGQPDASAVLSMSPSVDNLVEIPLGADHPSAFILRPPGTDPLPAVIILGGSEGGDSAARGMAPRLASRGYAAVGLPYYGGRIEGLPQAFADLPLDRVEQVRDLLRERDDIDDENIGLWGVSKGGEYALAVSSRVSGFAAVVAIVPSDVIWLGWGAGGEDTPSSFSWRGERLAYVPYLGMGIEFAKYERDQKVAIRTPHDAGRLSSPERVAAARIAVEDIDAPVFLVGGDSDETWDSGGMARNIYEAREKAGLETVLLVDKQAGHFLSGDAYTPVRRRADAALRRKSFPAMLEFLETHLKDPPRSSGAPNGG